MSENAYFKTAWLFVGIVLAIAIALFAGGLPASASDDHEDIRQLRDDGKVLPLSTLLARDDLRGLRILEAELEREDSKLVYELEVLDGDGRVSERHYDARSGELLKQERDD